MIPPRVMMWFHATQVVVWAVMIPIAWNTSLKDSVQFLVMISLLALVCAELAALQACLAERRMDDNDEYGE